MRLILGGLLAASLGREALAQEIDTAIHSDQHRSILQSDKLQNPIERRDFLELYRETNARDRHSLAERFIQQYPRSWLLAEAYEAEAKASIDLDQYDSAMVEAEASLRLFPENALLLVPLANVQAKKGRFTEAEQNAKDALDYLEMFAAPSGMEPETWLKLKPELEGSAYFALGKVYAARGLSSTGAQRIDLLGQAKDALSRAVAWNRKDSEAFYLRGLVEEAGGASIEAASDLVEAEQDGAALRAQITSRLHQIYENQRRSSPDAASSPVGHAASFQDFLLRLPPATIAPLNTAKAAQEVSNDSAKFLYAGSRACAECHRDEYLSWQKTGMARMLRAYDAKNIMGEFGPDAHYEDDSGAARMGRDDRPFIEIRDPRAQQWEKFHVDYTIGSKWQQAYVTKLPDGRLQVLPVQYNLLQHRWVNYWKLLDPAGSVRASIARFPELLLATNYQENCSVCHTSRTQPSGGLGNATASEPIYREMGVNCEMCHGPSMNHVKAMRGTGRSQMPLDFKKISNREEISICSQCHRQSLIRNPQYGFDWSTWISDRRVGSPGISQPYPDFSQLATYKDGRFRQTTFIAEALTRTACFRKGGARCSNCHNPHGPKPEENITSLKFRDNPDLMCLQCHSQYSGRIEQHTHHAATSAASRCTACHMPRIMEGLMFRAMSHQIDDIPDAQMTDRFGQEASPNACLICHTDKDTGWIRRKMAGWNDSTKTSAVPRHASDSMSRGSSVNRR